MHIKFNLLMYSTKDQSDNTTFTKFFNCPVELCGMRIHENSRQIADHIRKSHPTITKKMGLDKNLYKRVFICKPCDSYTSIVHHHCYECEHPELPGGGKPRYFKTVEERNEHLKKDHNKWWLEYECTFGLECRGKNGGCGFNHNHFDELFLTDTTNVPSCICRYDRPWAGQRCLRDKCSFSHFWGRVRYLIKSRAVKSPSDSACGECNSEFNAPVKTTENTLVVDE